MTTMHRSKSATVAWALLLITADPWGATSQASGALALVKTLGFCFGVALAVRGAQGRIVSPVSVLLTLYASSSVVGALLTMHEVNDSIIRAMRLVAVTIACVALSRHWTLPALLKVTAWICGAMAGVAVLGSVVGYSEFVDGRLAGTVPPLNPNSLAAVSGVGLVISWSMWLSERLSSRSAAIIAASCVLALVLSQSRTSLLACAVALAFAFAFGRARRSASVLGIAALAVSGIALVGSLTRTDMNPFPESRFEWDATFTGRTQGWDIVANLNRPWTLALFGSGLSVKYVADPSVYGGSRPIDGTWFSVFLEAGWIGVVLIAVVVALVIFGAIHKKWVSFRLPLLVFLLIHSVFESTLNDVTLPLVVFLGLAVFSVGLPRIEANLPREGSSQNGAASSASAVLKLRGN